MKPGTLLPLSFLVLSLSVYAAPSPFLDSGLNVGDIAQSVLAQSPFNDQLRSDASQWLDEAKQVILRGKQNLEKWFYKGRQYIKQDNLLCARISSTLFSLADQHL
jgi:hypothetical protein